MGKRGGESQGFRFALKERENRRLLGEKKREGCALVLAWAERDRDGKRKKNAVQWERRAA